MAFNNKQKSSLGDAVKSTLTQIIELQNHPALSNQRADDYAEFLSEVNAELRTLQASLTEHDPTDLANLGKWCAEKRTLHRLTNLQSTLDTMLLVDNENKVSSSTQPSNQTWKNRDEIYRHTVILKHQIHHVRSGSRYNSDFISYLDLTSLSKAQQETAAKLKKLETAKERIAEIVNVAGRADDLASKIASSAKTTASITHAGDGVAIVTSHGASALAHSSSAMSSFLQAIPIVGAAVSAVSSIVQFGQSFLQKRGVSDKIAKGIAVGIGVAAVVLTVIFPVAATGIAAGLIASGVVMNYVKPYIELRKQIKQRNSDLSHLKERIIDLDKPDTILNQNEKQALLQRLQKNFVTDKSADINDLIKAKQAINQGNLKDIKTNPLVLSGLKLTDNETVLSVLKQHNGICQNTAEKDIAKMSKERNIMLAQSINGGFSIAGAIMLAIPFPPVMIAGAALLLASSVVGIAIKYREQIAKGFNKIKDGIKIIFGLGNKDAPTTTDGNTNELGLKNSVEMSSMKSNSDSIHQNPISQILTHATPIAPAHTTSNSISQQPLKAEALVAEPFIQQQLLQADKKAKAPTQSEELTTPQDDLPSRFRPGG